MNELSFFAPGRPAPQGSKRYVGHGVMVESSKRVKPWRSDVRDAAINAMGHLSPLSGAVRVTLRFVLGRPKGHLRTGKKQTDGFRLLPSAPRHHATKPDLDKLIRAALDAMTGVCWRDDSQVVSLICEKGYICPTAPLEGLHVTFAPVGDQA